MKFRLTRVEQFNEMMNWVRNNVEKAAGKRKWIDVILESNASPSVIQRSKFHAMLNDINRQGVGAIGTTNIDMRKYDYDECKTLIVKWFLTEKKLNGDELKRSVNPRVILDPIYRDAVYLRPSRLYVEEHIMEFETFEVRQNLNTAIGGRMIVVHEGSNFREAEMFYDSVVKQYPDEYFEFCKIYKKQTCINWVKR